MPQQNKFIGFERDKIERFLKVVFPEQTISLVEGDVKISQPDGIIIFDKEEIGIELRRVFTSDSLQQDSAIKKIKEVWFQELKNVPPYYISFNADQIPIDKRKLDEFIEKGKTRLLELIPNVVQNKEFRIGAVDFKVFIVDNDPVLRINHTHTDSKEHLYFKKILDAIKEKNAKHYSTKRNWLLLCEDTQTPSISGNFEELSQKVAHLKPPFEKIFLLKKWKIVNVDSPSVFQLYPELNGFNRTPS